MNEFITKLIERLEESTKLYIDDDGNMGFAIPKNKVIQIVNQLAEEYQQKEYCWQSCSSTEHCKECSRLGNGNIDYFEDIANWGEEYNNGWIPCSERLPEDDSMCLVTVEYSSRRIAVDYGWFDRVGVCWYVGMHEFRTTNVHAWQPLPQPYQPKGE